MTDLGTTYLLRIYLKKSRYINIGKLGRFYFKSGHYFYVGSAKKNFYQRIKRHLRKKKKKFWHIDYLLQHANVKRVLIGNLPEEKLAAILSEKMTIPVLGFGASDKTSKAHLFFSKKEPKFSEYLFKFHKNL